MEIKGKSIVVTGAASGLGEATARRLSSMGAKISVFDLDAERGNQVAADIGGLFLNCDVTSEEAARGAIHLTLERYESIEILVNCAGLLLGGKVLGNKGPHDLSRFRKVIEVNLIGTFNVLRLAAEKMAANDPGASGERGVIVNTASIAAYEGQIGQCAYSSSKAGIAGLTLPAARELAKHGIRVCSIAPGVFDTAMLGGLPDEARNALAAQVPFPSRLGDPDEYARLVQQVIENPMLNGEIIRIDGAMRMV
jgi:NAD(P)-dependent dehydrogenase (short-subunit alcohol dehydrogenase family)